jgi:D-erythro-7,8-dihydroneopterin triphosphate epimerase
MSAKKLPSRVAPEATINITNLRLRTFIGFNPEEREKQQDIVINIEIRYAVNEAALQDDVEQALNYKTITKAVIALVESGRFLLLERLVADVLAVCTAHEDVRFARVTIDKPHALRFADSVSLTLDYRSDDAARLTVLEKAS